ILSLLQKLKKEKKMSLILVSHDLGVIAQNTDRLLVMYAGEIVEDGRSMDVIQRPSHPYTEGLLKCLPGLHTHEAKDFRLPTITGMVPHLGQRPAGCQLSPRCSYKEARCEQAPVALGQISANREVRCIKPLSSERNLV